MAMGQNPLPPVNIPIPTKIGSKMGGAPTPKWDTTGFDPQSSLPEGSWKLPWNRLRSVTWKSGAPQQTRSRSACHSNRPP